MPSATERRDASRSRTILTGGFSPADRPTEFELLQQGGADFAIGSTINWSPQIKELNLFALPFMFQGYQSVDAVETGERGRAAS